MKEQLSLHSPVRVCKILSRIRTAWPRLALGLCLAVSTAGCHTSQPVAYSGSDGIGGAILAAGALVVTMADYAWEKLTPQEQDEALKNLASATDSEVRAAAVSAAQTNVITRRWRICHVYTSDGHLAGVPKEESEWLVELPPVPLPATQSNPLAARVSLYAETYNREFVRQFLIAAGDK